MFYVVNNLAARWCIINDRKFNFDINNWMRMLSKNFSCLSLIRAKKITFPLFYLTRKDGQTDGQTEISNYRVALLLKICFQKNNMVWNDSKLPTLKCHKRPLGANMDGRTDGRTDILNYRIALLLAFE